MYFLRGTQVANERGMSDKAFENVMNRIAGEAEAERVQEIKLQQRRARNAKIRKVCGLLLFVALVACGYHYRADIQQLQVKITDKLNERPKIDGGTGEAMKSIQGNSEKRDKMLDEITKK